MVASVGKSVVAFAFAPGFASAAVFGENTNSIAITYDNEENMCTSLKTIFNVNSILRQIDDLEE